jgi:hypothetical protein
MRSQIQIAWLLAGRLAVIRRCDGPGMEDYFPPPVLTLNLAPFWGLSRTKRPSLLLTVQAIEGGNALPAGRGRDGAQAPRLASAGRRPRTQPPAAPAEAGPNELYDSVTGTEDDLQCTSLTKT